MNTKHVTSLEISKQLAEAGIESEYVWQKWNNAEDWVIRRPIQRGKTVPEIFQEIPAPLATEILERLPENVTIISHINDGRLIGGNMAVHGDVRVLNNSLPNALALLLIRLTKDGLT
jgi:hypothetical protein